MNSSTKASGKTRESKTGNSHSHANKSNLSPPINSPVGQIFSLQRTVGNREVERLLKSGVIQAKLRVNEPGDFYEQEAEHVADRVIRIPQPQLQRKCSCGGGCPACQTAQPHLEQEQCRLNRFGSNDSETTVAPPVVHEALSSAGRPLDISTRKFMEPRFGHDCQPGTDPHGPPGLRRQRMPITMPSSASGDR